MDVKSKNRGNGWNPLALVLVLELGVFVVLYLFLPPSILLALAAFLVGLIAAVAAVRIFELSVSNALLSLVLMTAFLAGFVFLATRPVSAGTVAAEPVAAEIDGLLQKLAFGGAILVTRNDQVMLRKGYGYADRSRFIPNTLDTRFRLGSVGKQSTAMAVLMLQVQGRLNVHDRICRYLPECPSARADITIHQLLTHSSGMGDYLAVCFTGREQMQQAISRARSKPLAFQPGTEFAYSNIGYRVLAEIVEGASGTRYGVFLQGNIFRRLGMTRTAFETTDTPELAVGYTDQFFPACPKDVSFEYGDGGINSTVDDLHRWEQALNTKGLVPRELLDSMFTAHIPWDKPVFVGDTGYGWGIGQQSGHRIQIHGGFIQSFTSTVARFPDDHVAVILLSNQQNYRQSIYQLLADKLLWYY